MKKIEGVSVGTRNIRASMTDDEFSGPGRAIGLVCVCVCVCLRVRTITVERTNDF